MALPARNWHGKLIEIHFDHECGSLLVDACMLTRDGVDVRTYTSTGRLLTKKGKERQTKYATDNRDRRKKMVTPGGARKVYKYDNDTNDLIRETNTFGQPGKKVSHTDYSYDEFGNVLKTELSWNSGKKLSTENTYDKDGRFVETSRDSRGNVVSYHYNSSNGTLESVTDAEGKMTAYEYDPYLNPTKVTLTDEGREAAGSVTFGYDKVKHSQLKTITLADVPFYAFDYDSFGNVTSIKKGNEALAEYSYNGYNGKLNSVKFGNGDSAALTYNNLELIKERSFGGSDRLRYEYDSKGRLARIYDDNTRLTYGITYDAAERVTYSSIYDEGAKKDSVVFSSYYDKAGRQSSFSYYFDGKAFRSEYGYTTDDKITAALLPSGGYMKRRYDNLGRTATEVFTPQKKKATGEEKARGGGAEVTSILSYLGTDRAGKEGIDTGKDFDHTTKLLAKLETTIKKEKEDITALSDTLEYDKVGRVSKYNDTEYTYDALGRLTKASDPSAGNVWEYAYDSIGNLTETKSKVNGKEYTEEYSYDAKAHDEITSYTLNGEKQTIKMGKGGNPDSYRGYGLKWHRGSELESVEFTGKGKSQSRKKSKDAAAGADETENKEQEKFKAEYTYSYEGIRLKKKVGDTETEYVLNGSTILAQKTGEGADQELLNFYYTPEGKLLEIGYSKGASHENHYTVIKNAMGDVSALYTSDGTLVGSYAYDPYGKIISVNPNMEYNDTDGILEKNPFRYRGYYLDAETGWYYLNSRYYDPEVKRFINADSTEVLTTQCANLMQYNLFAYCNDNPINKTDEGGNLENWQKVAIGVGVIAVVGVLCVATGGIAAPGVACFLTGAFEGAVAGAASGAVIGAATGAVSSRISTGSWEGAGQAAVDGAATGFMTGAITGAITGGITSNHCFVAGTLVLMEDGYKAIETVEAGDMVYAADERTGEVSIKKVVRTFANETDELIHLQIGDSEVVTTPGHPFFIYGKGFEFAGNLRAGDILVNVNGEQVVLEFIQHEILESPVKVYNFEVEDWHTYFVGNDGVWVHNMCGSESVADDAINAGKDLRNTPDQDAVLKLAKEAKKNGGVDAEDAKTIIGWAEEYDVPFHGPEQHLDRPQLSSQNWHFHIGNSAKTGHIPIISDIANVFNKVTK